MNVDGNDLFPWGKFPRIFFTLLDLHSVVDDPANLEGWL